MNELQRFSGECDAATQKEFIPFIHELAQASAEIIRHFYLSGFTIETKSDATPVTIADRRAEEIMRDLIVRRYPQHGIFGEEFGAYQPTARYQWVLDPIDGTKAFVSNCYLFGTLIALLKDGRPVLGAINNPLVGHLLIGTGRETYLNENLVRVRPCHSIAEATLLVSSHWGVEQHQNFAAFESLARCVKLYRTWGDCLGYLLLATGGADVMADPIMNPWDIMALIPVIEGAGGRITDWQGNDPVQGNSIIATAGILHDEVIALLNPDLPIEN